MFFQYANRVNVETKIIKNKLLENNELVFETTLYPLSNPKNIAFL